jgi:hypothetical protein
VIVIASFLIEVWHIRPEVLGFNVSIGLGGSPVGVGTALRRQPSPLDPS